MAAKSPMKDIYKARQKKLIEEEYKRERKRVLQAARRARNKGFNISEDIIPEKPTNIKKSDIQKLQRITPEKLRKTSVYKPENIDIKTGKLIATESDKKSGKKVPSTKAKKVPTSKPRKPKSKKSQEGSSKKGKKSTSKGKKSTKGAKKSAEKYGDNRGAEVGGMILENILTKITSWTPSIGWSKNLAETKRKDKDLLYRIITGVINKDGASEVEKRLQANAEKVNDIVDKILYHYGPGKSYDLGRDEVQHNIQAFIEIVQGHKLTQHEGEFFDAIMDEQAMYDRLGISESEAADEFIEGLLLG